MDEIVTEAKNPVKGTKKTFRIVEALKELNGAGVTELANHLDLPVGSVHNYLSTLREDDYVVKERETYHVGLRFLNLGTFARHRRDIYEVAKPEVAELAETTGELANLMVEERGLGIYIYREAGQQAVKVDARTGHRVHLHNTALGKAILAFTPREITDEILDYRGMPKTTEKTITDRDELYDELEAIQEKGVAFDREERLEGAQCVAAPITDENDRAIGAISVSGPTSRMTDERFEEEIPDQIRDTVNVLNLNLTYR
jgi:DNA-binding IclR family transcriptional regulator